MHDLKNHDTLRVAFVFKLLCKNEAREVMESKTIENQVADDNFAIFYATICHVCKRFHDVRLKRCGGCNMIAYCGQQHQKQHWVQHKPLCKAIRKIVRVHNIESCGGTLEEWRNIKTNFMLLVSFKLGRRLDPCEQQMFMFPRECAVCHERNGQLLEDCQKCAASFCKSHRDSVTHRNNCASLELCFHLSLLIMTDSHLPDQYLQFISAIDTFMDTSQDTIACRNFIFRNFIRIPAELLDNTYDNALAVLNTDFLTRPLTVFHAMELLDYIPKRKDVIIHVVAADTVEEITVMTWKFLLNLINKTFTNVTSLVVIMIGPELNKADLYESHFSDPSSEKKLSWEFHDVLYDNYAGSSSFVKPDLIVGFNTGIHEQELGSTTETWTSSIQLVAKQRCPFILTCYTQEEKRKDVSRINTILNKNVNYLYCGKNPFASLRPHRSFEQAERVYYQNHYMIVYRSLCQRAYAK